jgi:hypothetical protein
VRSPPPIHHWRKPACPQIPMRPAVLVRAPLLRIRETAEETMQCSMRY